MAAPKMRESAAMLGKYLLGSHRKKQILRCFVFVAVCGLPMALLPPVGATELPASIKQLSDLQPSDWAYQALWQLVERHGCVAGQPLGSFLGQRALSRYEAAALLNRCLERVTEISPASRQLIAEFAPERALLQGQLLGLDARLGELEASQFSTSSKLSGSVRYVMGDAYRGPGLANFGQGSALLAAARLYGQRAYDGSSAAVQQRAINRIPDPLSQGEAFAYYRPTAGPALARQLAFSSSWAAFSPDSTGSEPPPATSLPPSDSNGFYGGNTAQIVGAANYGALLLPASGASAVPVLVPLLRVSVVAPSGFNAAFSAVTPGLPTGTLGFLKPGANTFVPLQGDDLALKDRYFRTSSLRLRSSGSFSDDFSDFKILLDRQDMQALVQLANNARRVKGYSYVKGGSGFDPIGGIAVLKPVGVADPISISESSSRIYTSACNQVGACGSSTALAAGNLSGNGTALVVAPGGLVTNGNSYDSLINYLLAEYGSLSESQRRVGYVQQAATKFIRNLAAYTNNLNGIADRNAFTFSHDASLNFGTSFSGKDELGLRLRTNSTYAFSARVATPAAGLSYDGAVVDWPNNATQHSFVDKLYYRLPFVAGGTDFVVAAGTRLGQDAVLPSRGTYYTKDALLNFFNSSAGVFPSYTGTGFGLSVGELGGKGFGLKGLSFGIAYLASEADAVAPDASNSISQGWFGSNTRFRLPVQLAWQSVDRRWLFSANYAHERGDNSMAQAGTQLALTPFLYASLNESDQLGFSLAYQWSDDFSLTAAYGHASVQARYDNSVLGVSMAKAGDAAVMNSWMLALNFKNLFLKGNSAGLAIGGVPSLVLNQSGWNRDGGMPTALESWYQFQLSDNVSLSPGVFYISGVSNSDGIGGGDIWGGVLKTQFNF